VKLWHRIPKRLKRIAALAIGTGLAFMGAGNLPWLNMDALESVVFGASGSVIALVIALSFTYAGKGEVPDKDFDTHMNATIESVQSKIKKKD